MTKDSNVRDSENDPKPTKGTNEPWKRPGQASQDPDETIAGRFQVISIGTYHGFTSSPALQQFSGYPRIRAAPHR